MHYTYPQSYLSTTVLAGVFAGLAATLGNLGYDVLIRSITEFSPSQIINVATIIFATMIIFTICGVAYFFISRAMNKGSILYTVVFGVITLLCLLGASTVQRSSDPAVSADFRLLLMGIIVISGGLATFFIPYLMKHQSMFIE